MTAAVEAEAAAEGSAALLSLWVRCCRYRIACDLWSARQQADLTQAELARIAGVRRTDVSLLENTREGVSADHLVRIVAVLSGSSADWAVVAQRG